MGQIIETNSGDESKGYTFGLQGDLFIYPMVSIFLSVVIFTLALAVYKYSLLFCFAISLPHSIIVLAYVFLLCQDKPAGYHMDFWSDHLFGRSWSYRPHAQPPHDAP